MNVARDYDDHETFKDKDFHKLKLPEGKSGDHEVAHVEKPAGEEFETSTMRTAVIGRQPRARLMFTYPTTWHQLSYGGGVWMTDYPIEQVQHDVKLEPFAGEVLVGGLGLGYALANLIDNSDVCKITVVEVSRDVANLVWPHVDAKGKEVELVVDDLHVWLAGTLPETYDFCFFDIWQSDGERTMWKHVEPLRRLVAEGGFCDDASVICWNEDVMRGQLYNGLQARLMVATEDKLREDSLAGQPKPPTIADFAKPRDESKSWSVYWNWSCPFFEAIAAGLITRERAMELLGYYAMNVGRPSFLAEWQVAMKGGNE